ncbi:hypothetical protein OXX59_006618 [Metschnikowia pulcherrima]
MPKKKPEMSQVYTKNTNEFVFGENGGRGKNLSSFLKNLSLTGSSRRPDKDSSDNMRKVNSSIYGNMSYGYESPDQGGSALTSVSSHNLSSDSRGSRKPSPRRTASSSSALNLASNFGKNPASDSPSPSQGLHPLTRAASASADSHRQAWRRQKYADLDDDWDADFSEMGEAKPGAKSPQSPQKVASSAQRVPASALVDSLYPDLTIQSQIEEATEAMPKTATPEPNRAEPSNRTQARIAKFTKVLGDDAPAVNIQELRKLSWNGVPSGLRAVTWQLLLGYLPTNKTRQSSILQRKRQEYVEGMAKYAAQFDEVPASPSLSDSSNRDNSANKEKQLFHQINIDVKRTNQTLRLYSYAATQKSLKKILFLWAIRHPASGYVQGINDICTPFYQIFLQNYLWQLQRKHAHEFDGANDDSALFIPGLLDESFTEPEELEIYNDPNLAQLSWENFDPGRLSSRVAAIIEADSYWCISRLLDNITDNYIHEQPGIIKQVTELHDLIAKIDAPLVQHLQNEGIEFLQFSFRWMNCLLMRELSIELVIRMWDTYLSETPLGFSGFHIYVCAAFLIKFSAEIKEKDFQDILLFLQNPPTATWTEQDIELMLSEAFIWQSLYKNAGARAR